MPNTKPPRSYSTHPSFHSSNFTSKFTDNRKPSQNQPYQIQKLFTKALELPPKPEKEKVTFPETKKPEIDVVKIKSVMKNVTLPPIEKSSVSSLSTKMKDLSDSEFRTVMQKMLSSKKTTKK